MAVNVVSYCRILGSARIGVMLGIRDGGVADLDRRGAKN